jgi:cell division protein FtsQ
VSDNDDDTSPGGVVISLERPPRDSDGAGSDDEHPGEDDSEELVLPSVREIDESAVVLDVRMRRRRLAVENDARDRRYRRIAWGLVPVALLVMAAVVAYLPMLDVDRVLVEGATRTPPATVQWASRVHLGDALLATDAVGAERRIEALPWIKDATVKREWPGTVRITVTERTPIAVLVNDEGRMPGVVDASGRIIDVGGLVTPGLVELTGMDPRLAEGARIPARGREALKLAVALTERLPGQALGVNVDLEVSLAVGGIARFGSIEQLDAKLVALETILTDVDTSDMAVLDLRVPSNPTITRN